MDVLILAAGYGTRLYPLTINKPKALLKVGQKTILDHLMDKLDSISGVSNICLTTNDKFFVPFKEWAKENPRKIKINVLNDKTLSNDDRLGAIGDIKFSLDNADLSEDLLVLGSDNLFEFNLKDFVEFAISKKPSVSFALFDIKDKEKASLYGIAEVKEGTSELLSFEEKPKQPKSTLAATAIYFYPAEKLNLVTTYMSGGNTKDAPGNFIKWLIGKEKVYAYVFKEKWFDIGDKESLEKADQEYKGKDN